MFPRIQIGFGIALFLAVALHASPSAGQARGQASATKKQPRMTQQQFEALPPNHVLQVGAKRITKRELLAQVEQRRAALKKQLHTVAAQDNAAFETQRAVFAKEQAAKIQMENAKTRQQFASVRGASAGVSPVRPTGGKGGVSPQRQAIEREAAELYAASKKATPAERVKINQRAAQLLQQLQQAR